MAKRMMASAAWAAMACVIWAWGVCAGEAEAFRPKDGVMTAGVFAMPPFVMTDGEGGFRGLAIDVWERATEGFGFKTRYEPFRTMRDLLEATAEGRVDVAVADVSVTHERARLVKFSFPWYDSGLRIMVNKPKTSFWAELYESRRFQVYLLFFVMLAVLALLMTWLRRRRDPEFPRDIKTGYTLSLLDVTSSVRSGELEQEYLGWFGHVLSALWMMFGLAMVAYVTSTMTTAMTTVHLDKSGIYALEDLPGKKVGALQGGLTLRYLRSLHMNPVPCVGLREAVERLRGRRVQAVVSDAPALEYWVATHPEDGVQMVGDLFHPDKFAFATRKGNEEFMDRVSVELIRMQEKREIAALREKYFGGESGN